MIGFGSIGKGTLPLIERHIAFDRSKFVVIAPDDSDRHLLDERSIRFMHQAVTKENYREVLTPLLTVGPGRGMVVNLSVDTSSVDLMELAKDLDAFYIDTVVEPWPGLYTDRNRSISERSNYALREGVLDLRRRAPRRRHRGVLLRRQSRHGVVDRQAGAARHRRRAQARRSPSRRRARTGPPDAARRRQGHPHRRARHPARRAIPSRAASSSTPGRSRASSRKACSRPSSAGARTRRRMPPNAAPARLRLRRRDLSEAARRRHAGALVDADGAGPARLPGHPQRVDLDRRLLHAARGRQGRLPADLPLRLSPLRRRRAVAARAGRRGSGSRSRPGTS